MSNETIEWTVEYFKKLNERLRAVGMPEVIIDEENKMVYKDSIHKLLEIGIKLEA